MDGSRPSHHCHKAGAAHNRPGTTKRHRHLVARATTNQGAKASPATTRSVRCASAMSSGRSGSPQALPALRPTNAVTSTTRTTPPIRPSAHSGHAHGGHPPQRPRPLAPWRHATHRVTAPGLAPSAGHPPIPEPTQVRRCAASEQPRTSSPSLGGGERALSRRRRSFSPVVGRRWPRCLCVQLGWRLTGHAYGSGGVRHEATLRTLQHTLVRASWTTRRTTASAAHPPTWTLMECRPRTPCG